jgi:hypothetical protein
MLARMPRDLMRVSLWIAGLWPGFGRAWVLRRWDGLALAVGFGVALTGAMVATFVANQWLPVAAAGSIASVGWISVIALWALGLSWLRADWPRLSAAADASLAEQVEGLFREAQHEYLKGHWIEAELLVRRLLKRVPADVEARLLLASIERRSNRLNVAKKTLADLQRVAGNKWALEIEAELRQMEQECGMQSADCGIKAA